MIARSVIAALVLALVAPLASAVPTAPAPLSPDKDPGAILFRQGIGVAGEPITATREQGPGVQGQAAACVNCHQRSGLGGREGRSFIPPITGRYLFRPLHQTERDLDLAYVEGMRPDRAPYTDESLAQAIRHGVDSQGRSLSYLMPRYDLADADMAALVDYLKRLDQTRVPGITKTSLHIATIVTPDADPVKRRGMLDVMQEFFSARNVRQLGAAPRIMGGGKAVYAKTPEMEHRRWELHVWELTGPPSGWEHQLEQYMAKQPVFVVLSGIGGSHWEPVHAFCEHAAVPCLFPNVEVPVDRQRDFYSLYFTKGVLLEADLIASALVHPEADHAVTTVRQVYRAGDSGEAAAAALGAALAGHEIKVVNIAVAPGKSVADAVQGGAASDALVLWLRSADLAALGAPPPATTAVFLSATMGGLENAPLPAGWRPRATAAYPFDLPDRRRVRVDYILGWFRMRKIQLTDVQVQADTYLACGLLSETLSHMVDTLGRDYLVERLQSMLERRIITGYYPHLALATGQRFASKGGYLVHWPGPAGARVVAEGDWRVP